MKMLKKIWNIASTVLVVLLVIVAVVLMGTRLLGYRIYTIVSPSMEPAFRVGDLIYVKEVSASEVRVGDPITFVLNEDLVVATHRVIEIDNEDQCFRTKGDANAAPDGGRVLFLNLIGKPVFRIPLLGYVSSWAQNPPGTYILIGGGVLLLCLVFLPDLVRRNDRRTAEKSSAAPGDEPASESPDIPSE